MVTMSAVWDRTTAFLATHARAVTLVALLLIALPGAVDALLQQRAAVPGTGVGIVRAGAVVSLLLSLIGVFGQAVLVALVIGRPEPRAATALAGQRFPAVIGVSLILLVAATLTGLPLGLALAADGVTPDGMAAGGSPTLSGTSVMLLLLYLLVGLPLFVWLMARLSVLNGVVIGERRGLGAIRHSFALTRGLAARIVGAVLVIVVVGGIAILALRLIVGTTLRLLLPVGDGFDVAAGLTGVAVALGVAALTALLSVFLAQLYVAVRARLETTAAV